MSLQAHRPHYSGAIAPERMPLLVVVVVRLTWPHPAHVAGREDDRQRQQRTGQRGPKPCTAPTQPLHEPQKQQSPTGWAGLSA